MAAQDIQGFVCRQMQEYPKLRLLDIYKSCFQDYLGAEHLVRNRQMVKEYLDEELSTTIMDDLQAWFYEPCGTDSNYYRVSIRGIKEDIFSEDLLLDAFIRSANTEGRPSVDSWSDRWHRMVAAIDEMNINLPNYQNDKNFIDSVLAAGKYAISHSKEYRDAYHPHYRIVERGIFEKEIKPFIQKALSSRIQTTELIRTSQSWDGVELPDYLQGRPELVAMKYVFPPGQKLGWHHHVAMNYGVLTQGELTIIGLDGKTKVVHEGEAVVEMVGTVHHGENRGTKPVVLYMFYLSQKDMPLAVPDTIVTEE